MSTATKPAVDSDQVSILEKGILHLPNPVSDKFKKYLERAFQKKNSPLVNWIVTMSETEAEAGK